MSSPGVDLVLRVVADQLRGRECEGCGSPLAGGLALREQAPQRIVVEVICSGCERRFLLLVQPEVDGVAQIQ